MAVYFKVSKTDFETSRNSDKCPPFKVYLNCWRDTYSALVKNIILYVETPHVRMLKKVVQATIFIWFYSNLVEHLFQSVWSICIEHWNLAVVKFYELK